MIFVCAAFAGLLFLFTRPKNSPGEEILPANAGSVLTLERDRNLQAEADDLLGLFDKMASVPVLTKDELMLKSGTNIETSAAYTHCFGQEFPVIFVKKTFYRKANRKQLVNALKHELTHAWLCRRRQMSVGHGAEFRRKFTEVGGFGN